MQIALHDGRTVETTTATKAELLDAANALGMTIEYLTRFGDLKFRQPWQDAVEALAQQKANQPELQPSPLADSAEPAPDAIAAYEGFRRSTYNALRKHFDAVRASDFATALSRRQFNMPLSARDKELIVRYREWYARRSLAGQEPQRELATT